MLISLFIELLVLRGEKAGAPPLKQPTQRGPQFFMEEVIAWEIGGVSPGFLEKVHLS